MVVNGHESKSKKLTFLSISFIPITNKVNAHEWSDSEFNDILMAIINHQEFFNANVLATFYNGHYLFLFGI